ncbi:MAG: hypothetical protein H7144_01690 [Burkholderiales bacterium]|nr:hypothetical protein [Phycisphaerae bacterium]
MSNWLLDESKVPTIEEIQKLQKLVAHPAVGFRSGRPALAGRLSDIIIHDTLKWFGGADIRLDVMVLHGPHKSKISGEKENTIYQPSTFRFPGIHDNERLPVGDPGLLVFYGRPNCFLDLSLLVSRDRKDTADLGALISQRLGSREWKDAAGNLLGLAVAAPQAS